MPEVPKISTTVRALEVRIKMNLWRIENKNTHAGSGNHVDVECGGRGWPPKIKSNGFSKCMCECVRVMGNFNLLKVATREAHIKDNFSKIASNEKYLTSFAFEFTFVTHTYEYVYIEMPANSLTVLDVGVSFDEYLKYSSLPANRSSIKH